MLKKVGLLNLGLIVVLLVSAGCSKSTQPDQKVAPKATNSDHRGFVHEGPLLLTPADAL